MPEYVGKEIEITDGQIYRNHGTRDIARGHFVTGAFIILAELQAGAGMFLKYSNELLGGSGNGRWVIWDPRNMKFAEPVTPPPPPNPKDKFVYGHRPDFAGGTPIDPDNPPIYGSGSSPEAAKQDWEQQVVVKEVKNDIQLNWELMNPGQMFPGFVGDSYNIDDGSQMNLTPWLIVGGLVALTLIKRK